MAQNYNIDLLVISCDNYSDVWDIFFSELFKFWVDCPINIYLLSNFKSFDHSRIKSIKVGEDKSWSDNLLIGLDHLEKDYVLIIIEDLLIRKNISLRYFNKISKWIDKNKPNYLRLTNSHNLSPYDSLVWKIPDKTPYKTSIMPCIWKRDTLKELLRSGESAWDFEVKGTIRAYTYPNFYSLNIDFINYYNSIIKGKWRRAILKYETGKKSLSRPIMSYYEEIVYLTKIVKSKFFNILPIKLKRLIRD